MDGKAANEHEAGARQDGAAQSLVASPLANYQLLRLALHEMRTPLTSVQLNAQLIERSLAKLGLDKELIAVENVRGGISKASMIHNFATPHIEVDPETYEVRADGELLTCEPAEVLPMAQRYFMY